MDHRTTPLTFAIDLLHAGLERERILERLQERFECNRHDAITVAAKAGAALHGARAGRPPWDVR
ncbi:MAG: hypothetical protein M3Q30_09665 [Actinomycetota bacterium]|nr:hypothetical protein [Actinomycetota bacterium]